MAFDFEGVLVAATLICGVIWALDALFFAAARRARVAEGGAEGEAETTGAPAADPVLVEYARSFFPVLLIVLLLRSFVVEPFRIPSESMLPTLEVGDFIVVNKFSYGVRLPVLHSEVMNTGEPERGDVVVFRYPRNPSINYIKRIVGLPGDEIAYYNRRLFVNGTPVTIERVGTYVPPGEEAELMHYQERLGEGEHGIVLDPSGRSIEGEYEVPEGEYFVMGDNRDHSNDSRRWGAVPDSHLVGEAEMIWMHWDWDSGGIGWARIGNMIE
ncbi:MAG: signal peptidase I [Halofilum sp. (in: g-proteobacteria)]